VAAKERETRETTMSQATIDVEESEKEKKSEEEDIEERDKGGAELESPFIVWTRKRQTSTGLRKKQKFDRSVGTTPLVLTEGDLDEIGDMVHDTMTNIWGHFEEQY